MKKILSLIISAALLAFIYHKINIGSIVDVFSKSSVPLLIASLGMVIPLTMATSWRLCQLMPRDMQLGFVEANRLTLMASVLNMVLPSKMGDVAKAAFMAKRGHLNGSMAVSLVIFEKACDMAALLAWCALGLAIYPQKNLLFWWMTAAVACGFCLLAVLIGSKKFAAWFFIIAAKFSPGAIRIKLQALEKSWGEMHGYFWGNRGKLATVAFSSCGIWFLHLMQIWLFTMALHADVPFMSNIAISPLALFAGLLPLTFAGVGTRDAALVFFYSPYMNAANAAALGVLCTMRYVIPAIAGTPFMGDSLGSLSKKR